MGKPTPQEIALHGEVRQLRERIAKIEQGRQAEASLVGEIDLQSLTRTRVPAQENDARPTGITVIGDVPWGTHFCQFYQDQQDLIDILVPYFKAGLENNEVCIWITSEPLASDEAKAALAAKVENLETYIAAGQLEILDSGEFYTLGGTFEPDRAFQGLIDRVETATRRGFAGLRVTGNLSWLEEPNWRAFTEYEAAVNAVIGNYPMVALCSYTLSKCGALEIMDIISNHAFALTKRAGKWERIDSAERKKVGVSLRDSEARFRALLTATSDTVYRMSPDCKEIFYLRGRDFILDSSEPTGTWLQKYIPRDDQQFVTAAIDEAIRNQSVFELEHRVLLADGSLGWTFSRAIPIRNAEGEVVEWFGAASDITERKRAEEAQRRSEARWNAAIENLGAAVVIATDTEQVIYRNRAARAMHGFTSDQDGFGPLQDMARIFELWTPDGRLLPLDEWPLRRIKRGETLDRLELRIRRLDQGWEKIISYSGAMVESAIGERLMFVSAQDLTDQRKAEHSLRESEERLRLLGDHLPDSAVYQYVDEPGVPARYTYFSAGIERLTGVTAEDVLRDKSTLHSQILPEHMDRFVEAESRSKRDLSDFDIEVPLRRADGEIRWIHFHSRPRRLPDGQTIWDGVETDVTARKQAEDALRESQQRLVSIYHTVEDGIFHLAVEPEGQFRIVSVNAAFLRVTGLSQEKVVGKTVNEVIPEPSLTMVLRKYRQAIEDNTVVHWEETSDYPAGRLTGEVSVTPVFDMTGTCTHLIGSVHDITDRKRAQEVEDRLTSDLTASRDEIRALAASLMRAQEDERRRVSRELHDHICQQLGFLAHEISTLGAGPLASKDLRVKLEDIQARVVKTSQETQHIAHQMHTAVLDDLGLVASLKHLCGQFSEHHPEIALDFEGSVLPALIPSEASFCLYRIAQESLQNIAKHSRAKCVSVRIDFKKQAVVLTIQDDGVGFDPKAVKGHGRLGLISMQERAHLVNGKLTITAELGHGTRISLRVPLPVEQLTKCPRVLLADDHPVILAEIRAVLAPNCEIVETVADGRALVEAALRLKPDLIVVDITMPLLNGLEAAVQIKKSLPGIKLLFVTMHASTAYVKAAFEAGGTGYVLKSGLRDELPDAVQSVLGGRTYVSHGLPTLKPGAAPGSYAPAPLLGR